MKIRGEHYVRKTNSPLLAHACTKGADESEKLIPITRWCKTITPYTSSSSTKFVRTIHIHALYMNRLWHRAVFKKAFITVSELKAANRVSWSFWFDNGNYRFHAKIISICRHRVTTAYEVVLFTDIRWLYAWCDPERCCIIMFHIISNCLRFYSPLMPLTFLPFVKSKSPRPLPIRSQRDGTE